MRREIKYGHTTIIITFRAKIAWWVNPFLRAVYLWALITQTEPDMKRITRIVRHGILSGPKSINPQYPTPESPVIKPTVGRVVWFHPECEYPDITQHNPKQPLAGIVAYVLSDRIVNLAVFDQEGRQHAATTVLFVQGDVQPDGGAWAEWPRQEAIAR